MKLAITQGSLSLKILQPAFVQHWWVIIFVFFARQVIEMHYVLCSSCFTWTETHFSLVLSQNPNFPATPLEFVRTDEAYTVKNVSVEIIGEIAPKPGEN